MTSYNEVSGVSRTPFWAIGLSAVTGTGFVWLILNIYTWKFRELSIDRKYKSNSDYD